MPGQASKPAGRTAAQTAAASSLQPELIFSPNRWLLEAQPQPPTERPFAPEPRPVGLAAQARPAPSPGSPRSMAAERRRIANSEALPGDRAGCWMSTASGPLNRKAGAAQTEIPVRPLRRASSEGIWGRCSASRTTITQLRSRGRWRLRATCRHCLRQRLAATACSNGLCCNESMAAHGGVSPAGSTTSRWPPLEGR